LSALSVAASQRFMRSRPCPVCGGGDDEPRGKGRRCSGFLSSDGRYAHCTREEHAGLLSPDHGTAPPTYTHFLEGECHCGATHGMARPKREIADTYQYVDKEGKLLFEAVRFNPKGFSQRRPDGSGGWHWNLNGVERTLYRLPAVLQQAQTGGVLYICEGEKDVHALESVGAVATCNPGGAGKWRNAYNELVSGAAIVIVADNDPVGLGHARDVATSLGISHDSIVRPAEGKDAHDHIAAGLTTDHFVVLEEPEPVLTFTPISAFAAVDEPSSAPLAIDEEGGSIIPSDGFVLIYGDGGAGKTTLSLDLVCHLAAGKTWLGLIEPKRPLRVALIENEGPRAMFRLKLRDKLATGWDLDNQIIVLEEPWQGIDLRNDQQRDDLVRTLDRHKIDLLVAGPLSRLGMEGGGTLDEIAAFSGHLTDIQRRMSTPLTVLLIHHENRAGRISGAWEGIPDTLVHITAQGHGHTRVYWQKLRWSSHLHGKTLNLTWAPGQSFEIEDKPVLDDNNIADMILQCVHEHPGIAWGKVQIQVKGVRTEQLARVRDRLLKAGKLANQGTERSFKLYLGEERPEIPVFPDSHTGISNGNADSTPSGEKDRFTGDSQIPTIEGNHPGISHQTADNDEDDGIPF
jgi:hypothetical protein